mmetsp:Transcript_11524/g.40734  ORF Transcript_11524/g.40734 Transcript_11524/m.40734 type:complete len:348 (+) Transcript_11524:102-1145(+)
MASAREAASRGSCEAGEERSLEDFGQDATPDGPARFLQEGLAGALASLGARDWAIGGVCMEAARAMKEDLHHVDFKPHAFSFEGRRYLKPNISELDLDDPEVASRAPPTLAKALRDLGDAVGEALPKALGITGRPAIKVQRNCGGAFPAHYDNAGPPSNRCITAILYFGGENDDPQPGDGGELLLHPFLSNPTSIAPSLGRLVFFKSDRVLHSVSMWRGGGARYAASFWFDSQNVNSPSDCVLTKDMLNFVSWDACAAFFSRSPLQRTISRAVCRETYASTLKAAVCGQDVEAMLAAHEKNVETIGSKLRPLISELRRRSALAADAAAWENGAGRQGAGRDDDAGEK